jgi:lipopolysaccharide/colanic/teichoic acid biosynthesis glycosyltransferase
MILRKWDDLPNELKTDEIRGYFDVLSKKKFGIALKRIFDITVSSVLLVLLSPVFLVLAIAIKAESKGPVFYRQTRITQYGENFKIFKFRSMVQNADKIGTQVTVGNDLRITKVGRIIRKFRLDEISQLIDVFRGTMTFVGTRPEVPKYVAHYTDEMMATLLLPAGVTSLASIYYKDESELLDNADDPENVYINDVLPAKMYYNLEAIREFSFWNDIKIMFMTFFAVLGKEYKGDYKIPEKERVEK